MRRKEKTTVEELKAHLEFRIEFRIEDIHYIFIRSTDAEAPLCLFLLCCEPKGQNTSNG